jgi:hypothetical protein
LDHKDEVLAAMKIYLMRIVTKKYLNAEGISPNPHCFIAITKAAAR